MSEQPTLEFAPGRPNEGTAAARILHWLETRGPICPYEATYTSRLAARIHELKRLGWNIEASRCKRHRHSSPVHDYRMVT